MKLQPLILINAVGLTRRLLAFAPRLKRLAEAGWIRSLEEVMPAVTCSAQASILTGKLPQEHGIVGNGWLFRDTREVRFWQQSSALIEAETIDHAVRRVAAERGLPFRVAKLFWWFNQGSAAEISVTPKPHYGADGNKVFGIAGTPDGLCDSLERSLGRFPFHTFWGPKAGLPAPSGSPGARPRSSRDTTLSSHWFIFRTWITTLSGSGRPAATWLAWCASSTSLRGRFSTPRQPTELRVWIVSEYGHSDVRAPGPLESCAARGGVTQGSTRAVR